MGVNLIVGIDLGKDGAVVVLDANSAIVWKEKTPLLKAGVKNGKKLGKDEYDIPAMMNLLIRANEKKNAIAILEKSQPMPMMMGGVAANFQRGLSFGLWQGLLVALGIPYEVVRPQAWQKAMLAGINTKDTKQAALIAARRLWPREDWCRSARSNKPDAGFIDAVLIAEHGRRTILGRGHATVAAL